MHIKTNQVVNNLKTVLQNRIVKLASALALCLCGLNSFSQSSGSSSSSWVNPAHTSEDLLGIKDGWFIGADIGRTLIYGDVALYNFFPERADWKKSFGNCGTFYFGKKLKWGLSAEAQAFLGTLKGEKRSGNLYPRYFNADFMQYSVNVKYNLSQMIFRDVPGRKFFNRFTVYLTAGGGQMFFRSRLYKYAVNNQWYLEKATGYTAVGIDSASATSGGGVVTEKGKMISAIAIPAGVKVNFKLNSQTDVVFDFVYNTIFTDQLDGWVRTWSHKDRYAYFGIGLVHNLNTNNNGDVPDDQRLFRPRSKKIKDAHSDDDDDSSSSKSSDKKGGLFNFGGGKSKSSDKKEDKDLELRMKMYELQLKLFEMQYLMSH